MNDNIVVILGILFLSWIFTLRRKERYNFSDYLETKELENTFCDLNKPIEIKVSAVETVPMDGDPTDGDPTDGYPTDDYPKDGYPTDDYRLTLHQTLHGSGNPKLFEQRKFFPRINDSEFLTDKGYKKHIVINSANPIDIVNSGYVVDGECNNSCECCKTKIKQLPAPRLENYNIGNIEPNVYQLDTTLEPISQNLAISSLVPKINYNVFSNGVVQAPNIQASTSSKNGYKTMGDLGVTQRDNTILDYITRNSFDLNLEPYGYINLGDQKDSMTNMNAVDYYLLSSQIYRNSIQQSAMEKNNRIAQLRNMYPMYRHGTFH